MDDLFEHLMESERDKAINGFYTHFIVFLAVIAGLAVVNLVTGDSFWIQWVVLGWGVGIAAHAFLIFVRRPQQEQKLREIRRAREEQRLAATRPAETASAPTAASGGQPGQPG